MRVRTVLCVTGTRRSDVRAVRRALSRVAERGAVVAIITGGAKGADTDVHDLAPAYFPGVRRIVCWPDVVHPDLNSRVKEDADHVTIVPRVAGSPGKTMMKRNDEILSTGQRVAEEVGARVLVLALPSTSREQVQGSGTWATIRRARKARLPMLVWPMQAERPWVERPID